MAHFMAPTKISLIIIRYSYINIYFLLMETVVYFFDTVCWKATTVSYICITYTTILKKSHIMKGIQIYVLYLY